MLKPPLILLPLGNNALKPRLVRRCTLSDDALRSLVDLRVGEFCGHEFFVFLVPLLEGLIDLIEFPVFHQV